MSAALDRLRHDLGKYVTLSQGFLEPAPADLDLRDALRADLLETRRGAGGVADAVAVWEELARNLDPSAPEHRAIADDLAIVARGLPALREGTAARPVLDELAAAARRIRGSCYGWHRRAGGR